MNVKLTYVRKQHEVGEVYSFFFQPSEPVLFSAGQYLNLTMPDVPPAVSDRLFTIASAPYEPLLQFTTIIGPSHFKQKLTLLQLGDVIEADQLGGDFIYDLPDRVISTTSSVISTTPSVISTEVERSIFENTSRSLDRPRPSDRAHCLSDKKARQNGQVEMTKRLFIAGGIGITPYLSIIRDRLHNKQPINAILLYAGKNEKRPFVEELHQAIKIDPTLNLKEYSDTRLTLQQLKKDVPNVEQYIVYLAGSQAFSEALGEGLVAGGFPRQQIKYDYFDGYVDIEY